MASFSWNRLPEQYSDAVRSQAFIGEELIRTIDFKPEDRVLDAGCGEGYYTSALGKNPSLQVYGFDIAREMIRLAAETGADVELLTNCTLLTEEMINGLMDAGLGRLWISIDDLETDSSINAAADRKNADHSGHNHSGLVLSNIRMLNKIRQKSLSSISLGITFVAMKSNAHQLSHIDGSTLTFMAFSAITTDWSLFVRRTLNSYFPAGMFE